MSFSSLRQSTTNSIFDKKIPRRPRTILLQFYAEEFVRSIQLNQRRSFSFCFNVLISVKVHWNRWSSFPRKIFVSFSSWTIQFDLRRKLCKERRVFPQWKYRSIECFPSNLGNSKRTIEHFNEILLDKEKFSVLRIRFVFDRVFFSFWENLILRRRLTKRSIWHCRSLLLLLIWNYVQRINWPMPRPFLQILQLATKENFLGKLMFPFEKRRRLFNVIWLNKLRSSSISINVAATPTI